MRVYFSNLHLMLIGVLLLIWLVFKDWRIPYWLKRKPKQSIEEKMRFHREMKAFIRTYPHNLARDYYPEIMTEINALEEYEKAERDYNAGIISADDFEMIAGPLMDKIDIEDLN